MSEANTPYNEPTTPKCPIWVAATLFVAALRAGRKNGAVLIVESSQTKAGFNGYPDIRCGNLGLSPTA